TYTRATFREGQFAGNDVPVVSRWTANATASWNIWQRYLMLDATARFRSERYVDQDNTNTNPVKIPSYTLWDLRLAGEVDRFFWSVAVENIFDLHYFDYGIDQGAPGFVFVPVYTLPGRTFMVKAGVSWKLFRQVRLAPRIPVMHRDRCHDQDRGGEKRPDRAPQPGPERERQEHRERIHQHLAADHIRRDEVALGEGQCHEECRRDQCRQERGKNEKPDEEERNHHDARADIRNVVEREGERAPDDRRRQPDRPHRDRRDNTEAKIDRRDGQEIDAETAFDVVHDLQRAEAADLRRRQPDQITAKRIAPEDQEEQRRDEQKEFGDCGRHDRDQPLQEFRTAQLRLRVGRRAENLDLQVAECRDRPLQNLEFLLDRNADFRRAPDQVGGGRGEQNHGEIKHGRENQNDSHGRNPCRYPVPYGAADQRAERERDHERTHHRHEQGARKEEKSTEQDHRHRKGCDLRCHAPEGRGVLERRRLLCAERKERPNRRDPGRLVGQFSGDLFDGAGSGHGTEQSCAIGLVPQARVGGCAGF